jgi:hypothetical protein
VLIDSSHKRWFWITAGLAVLLLGIYGWFNYTTPGGLTGGSTIGLWYGILGMGLMVYAALLSALRRVPSWWWIGSRKTWLKGHIWLSLLSVVVLLCHSGFHWGGPLEQVLWLVFGLTIATGVFGLVVQQIIPRLMTTRILREAPYEQIPRLCQVLRRRADALADQIKAIEVQVSQTNFLASQVGMGAKVQFQQFYEKQIRPFLSEGYPRSSLLANPMAAEEAFTRLRALPALRSAEEPLTELQLLCDERRQLPEQERLHLWLHVWLLVHIPLSVMVLVLGVAHAILALYY